jgi:hypothetical protein
MTQIKSLIDEPVKTYEKSNLGRNLLASVAACAVLASAYGASKVTSDIASDSIGFAKYLGNSLEKKFIPENVFNNFFDKSTTISSNKSDINLTENKVKKSISNLNSNYSVSDNNYNICSGDTDFILDKGKITTPFGDSDLESNLNDIYLEYSRNVPISDRVCPLTDIWKTEFERLNRTSYNSQIIDEVTFNNVNVDIKSLEKYLERF